MKQHCQFCTYNLNLMSFCVYINKTKISEAKVHKDCKPMNRGQIETKPIESLEWTANCLALVAQTGHHSQRN